MKTPPLVLIVGVAGLAYLIQRGRVRADGTTLPPPVAPPIIAVPTPTPVPLPTPPIFVPPPMPTPTPVPTPTPPPTPLPGGGTTLMPIVLAAKIIAVSPGAPVGHFGERMNVAVIWVPETRESRGKMLPWDYRVYIGIGRPEAPWFGRQFQQEGPKVAQEYPGLMGGEPVTTVQSFFLMPEFGFSTGKKDIMVSIVAAPNPQDPSQGKDVSGIWPNTPADEWREVVAALRQDAIEIQEGAPVPGNDEAPVANQACGCERRYFSLRPS